MCPGSYNSSVLIRAIVLGVIERRHARRQNTAEFNAPSDNVAAAAFDKVKIRNGHKLERRTKIIGGAESSSQNSAQNQTPERARTPDPEPTEDQDNERKPLLSRYQSSRT